MKEEKNKKQDESKKKRMKSGMKVECKVRWIVGCKVGCKGWVFVLCRFGMVSGKAKHQVFPRLQGDIIDEDDVTGTNFKPDLLAEWLIKRCLEEK